MNNLLVSVCITTFNHEKYIQDCLVSVLTQIVNADIEIIVGDDCSSDSTADKISQIQQRFPGKIQNLRHEKNLGPFQNLKHLVNKAGGQFIAHLDGDDIWIAGKLQAQLHALQANKECAACYTNAWVVSDALAPMGLFNNAQPTCFDIDYLLIKGNFLNHSSLLYRSEFKSCILNLPDKFIDYQIHLELAMQGPATYVNSAYVIYRHASTQSMVQRSSDLVRELYLRAVLDTLIKNNTQHQIQMRALANFWARIVKDTPLNFKFQWAYGWYKRLKEKISYDFFSIIWSGFAHGIIMILKAVLHKIILRSFNSQLIRIFNPR
jgi:glycosyltransferase involved in cell wall biosynthesis